MSELKTKGNEAFAAGRFQEADDFYAAALLELQSNASALPSDYATLHANRAAALLKLDRPAAALEEADGAVNKHLKWSKAHFRKGEAYRALRRWREASSCFFEAARLANNDPTLKNLAQTMRAKAAVEEEKSGLQRLEEYVKETRTIANVPVTPTSSQFIEMVELGEGNYSQVFKATFAPTGETIALKVIDKKKAERISMRHGNLRSELRAERRVLSKLNHCNIIRLLTAFQDAANIYYVEEFCAGRELWYRLKVVPPAVLKREWPVDSKLWGLCGLRPTEMNFFLAQIINALAYLRRQGIVHRDIKPENVMISEQAGDARAQRIKLIDFGTSRDTLDAFDDSVADTDKKDDHETLDDDNEPVYKNQPLGKRRPKTHFVGTPEFMSPEAVHGRPADHRSDLWSLGCMAFQLMTGRTPFKGASDYLTFLKADAAAYALPSYYSVDGPEAKFLERLLKVDPKERAQRAEDLRSEDLFKGIDFDALENPSIPPRLPIPTLQEICIERLGSAVWVETEAVGEGPLSRKTQRTFSVVSVGTRRRLFEGEDERLQMNLAKTAEVLDDATRTQLRRYLEQRSVLSCPSAMRLVYGHGRAFSRIENHSFLGYSHLEEGQYTDPYVIALMDDVRAGDAGDEIRHGVVARLNDTKPFPRLLFVASHEPTKEALTFLTRVRAETPIIRVPVGTDSDGRVPIPDLPMPTYVSLWVGGILYLVVDSARLDADPDQQAWFERELLLGKLCARYCVVVTNRRWFSKSFAKVQDAIEGDETTEDMASLEMRNKFLRMMQESSVQLIIKMGGQNNSKANKFVIPRLEATETSLIQVETPSFPSRTRIVRLLPTDAVTDPYAPDEFTGYFHLDTSEIPSDDDEARPSSTGRPYSSSSDSG